MAFLILSAPTSAVLPLYMATFHSSAKIGYPLLFLFNKKTDTHFAFDIFSPLFSPSSVLLFSWIDNFPGCISPIASPSAEPNGTWVRRDRRVFFLPPPTHTSL